MRSIKFNELAKYISIDTRNLEDLESFDANKIIIDSRKLKAGDIFMPIVGENFDGHDFIITAIESGLKIAFCERRYFESNQNLLKDAPLILVEDSLIALQQMARMVIETSGAKVVAVTGSTGKTTTKDLISGVLESKYQVAKTKGNFNNHIGLPLTVLGADEKTEVFVLEMGMNHFGEIEELVKIANPQIAVITNIGSSHIEHLGSQEGILRAKMEIVSRFNKENLLIINGYDPLLYESYHDESSYRMMMFGEQSQCDYKISEIDVDESYRHQYIIKGKGIPVHVELGISGRHNVMNSAAAVIIGDVFEIAPDKIREAIKAYQGENMRLTIIESDKGYAVINDAYNASIDSMKSSLEMITHYRGNKKFIFLGDMLEMGSYAVDGHRQVGDYVDLEETDYFLSIGLVANHIGERLRERGFDSARIRHFETFDEAAKFIRSRISKGDVLLIKGSRGMAMETVLKKL
jgi:UDP-N-acetylmuramoyl-tripeptide--D-alanyl-D-alanine ligase